MNGKNSTFPSFPLNYTLLCKLNIPKQLSTHSQANLLTRSVGKEQLNILPARMFKTEKQRRESAMGLTFVIPACGRLRQEDDHRFKPA